MISGGQLPEALHPKIRAATLSITANAGLALTELVIAVATGSLAVLADAFHSGVDFTGSVIAFWGIRQALRSSDQTHAYGYGRYENASALIQFVLIAVIGVTILVEVARRSIEGFQIDVSAGAIVVVIGTIFVDLVLFRYIAGRGRTLESSALQADSYHFATDALGKGAVLLGMSAAYLGFPVMDLVGASAIACAFIAVAFVTGKKNLQILVDASPDPGLLKRLEDAARSTPGVAGIHSLRARTSGNRILVDLCVHVDPDLLVHDAHILAHAVEERLRATVPGVAEAIVHTEPLDHPEPLESSSSDPHDVEDIG